MFKGIINLHGLNYTKNGFTKNRYYKTAYIRKLPKGYKMSEEAKLNAQKEGFLNIPTGYTFVKASNIDLEDESKEKVIKIK